MHNRLMALPLLLFIGFACHSNPSGPSCEHKDYCISLNDCVITNDGAKLSTFDLTTGATKVLYKCTDSCSICSFDYCRNSQQLFMILHQLYGVNTTLTTLVVRLASEGRLDTLAQLSTCYDCAGVLTYSDISVSPLGNYLAIEGSRYEGDFFRALDCQTSELLIFDKQYTEFVKILVWSPDGNSAYAKAHDYLVKYDMIMKQAEMLTSPNIRDYLTEAYLLEQGYVGDRIDMRALLGTDRIKFINWAPDGWSFVYQSWGEVGCLYSFDLRDMTNELILDLHSPYEWFKQFDIVWDRDLEPHADIPAFSNDDEIVSFDESILSSYLPLNDSAAYQIGRRYSISFLLPYWHGSASDRIKNLYFFRDQINEEKFHVAELDFLFWYFAFCQTPEYWFLLSRYGSCPEMTIDSLIAEFSTFNSDYYQDYLYFIGINYPDVLKHRKQEYNRLVYRDYRFQETFLHYLSNNDFNILKDSVLNIFRGEDTALIESCLDTLQYSPQEERKRQIKFYMLIHNNFSNYYGRVICPDLEQTKDNLLIEELMDDWFYKFASLYDDKYISVDYFRWKVLSLPHQSKSI